jgi:WD40 repeat protein/predicted Ser/Thr protein kinase
MPEPSPEAVEALFQQAAELDPEARCAFLDEQCAGDSDLRAAVHELLEFDAKAQDRPDFLQSPAAGVRAAQPLRAEAMRASFGRYRILRLRGKGGMGAVYEAEQDEPRRTVALKVMRPGLDSPELRKRFSQEVRILGRLHHVGIAQVYDAGATEDGQLYFAMEFIRGLPLDEHVRRHAVDARARLELVARVCDAVQHAHEHGVVHRDLKPANILVDETGHPKVLDFGVAHATGAGLLDSLARTRTGELIGTLGYMSPEQVAADPHAIDARSDVYALGVVLYELLGNRLPYRLDDLPIPEAVRVIRDDEPSRLGSVNKQFRGEIETIVAKALEKDKARRYPSAGELGADLRRFLRHEPISARPASAHYRVRKFVGRHKALVSSTAVAFAALLAATVISLLAARDARESARLARSQAYQAGLAAAVAALSGHDVADAARHLERAPRELRGWEWRHLHSRLDDSSDLVHLRPGTPAFLHAGPGGPRVGTFSDTALRFLGPYSERAYHYFFCARVGGQWLLASQEDPSSLVVRDETGRVVRTIKPDGGVRYTFALSPDPARVAIAQSGEQGHLRLGVFDTSTGKETTRCADNLEPEIVAMAFSHDGKLLAAGGDSRDVRIWDAATGRQLARCEGHTSKVLSLTFRQDGSRLLSASHDGTVRQWDAQTGREVEPPYDRHTAEVFVAAYSPDGQRIASAGSDRTVRLWWASGRQDQVALHGHSGAVSALAFSEDGRRLASASYDRADAQGDGTVRFWDATPASTLPVLDGHTSYVYPVAYSPDGNWIASGGWDKTVRLWDAATGDSCAKLPHRGVVSALAFGPDGTWLASGGHWEEEGLILWDVATAQIRERLRGVRERVESLAVSPDGTRVAVGTFDPTALFTTRVLDIATQQEVWAGEGLPFAFSPDGHWLAGRDASGKNVVLRDAQSFQPLAQWPGHTGRINAITFRRDGEQLLSASSDRTVRLWDVPTGRPSRVFTGHTDEVFGVAFHPDGTRIASAGRDRAVWLWDPARRLEVARLPGHTSYVWSLAFSPDGTTLVSSSGDTSVRLWDTEPARMRYQARRAAEALRPDAERLVEELFREKKNAAEVVAAVRADRSLGEPRRHAALRAALRRSVMGSTN